MRNMSIIIYDFNQLRAKRSFSLNLFKLTNYLNKNNHYKSITIIDFFLKKR